MIREIVVDFEKMSLVDLSTKVETNLKKKFVGECTGTVCKIAVMIKKLSAHNMAVHAKTYNNLLKFVFRKMQLHIAKN